MDRDRAAENLELIRTLMERSTRYELLSARTGLHVGVLGVAGSSLNLWLGPERPGVFGLVWAGVLISSVAIVLGEHVREVRSAGIPIWSRPATQIARALTPALVAALVLTVHSFCLGRHLELPGLWMICYGCGALATASWAPPAIAPTGICFLALGAVTLALGPGWSVWMMGLVFGGGHLVLGLCLRVRQRPCLRLVTPEE